MTEVRPRCKCQSKTCAHHLGDPGGCPRFETANDHLCYDCRKIEIQKLEADISLLNKQIDDRRDFLVATQTGMSPDGVLEDEEIIALDEMRKKVARERDRLQTNENKK
jgi:hypothetical protein